MAGERQRCPQMRVDVQSHRCGTHNCAPCGDEVVRARQVASKCKLAQQRILSVQDCKTTLQHGAKSILIAAMGTSRVANKSKGAQFGLSDDQNNSFNFLYYDEPSRQQRAPVGSPAKAKACISLSLSPSLHLPDTFTISSSAPVAELIYYLQSICINASIPANATRPPMQWRAVQLRAAPCRAGSNGGTSIGQWAAAMLHGTSSVQLQELLQPHNVSKAA